MSTYTEAGDRKWDINLLAVVAVDLRGNKGVGLDLVQLILAVTKVLDLDDSSYCADGSAGVGSGGGHFD